mgnify:CR=1 FL=1
MKKTLFKILGTLLTIVVFIITQYHIRRYYNIDPRIWFFVVFGISFVGFCVILGIFYSEIKSMREYFETHSFFEFVAEIAEKTKPITKKVKPMTEKIVNSFLYDLISFITMMVAFTGIMYKLFFHDDFMGRTIVYVIFLVMIAWTGLSRIIRATVIEKEKRSKEFVYAGMWVFIFLTNFLEFVCIWSQTDWFLRGVCYFSEFFYKFCCNLSKIWYTLVNWLIFVSIVKRAKKL